jgi:hypothetical protein
VKNLYASKEDPSAKKPQDDLKLDVFEPEGFCTFSDMLLKLTEASLWQYPGLSKVLLKYIFFLSIIYSNIIKIANFVIKSFAEVDF